MSAQNRFAKSWSSFKADLNKFLNENKIAGLQGSIKKMIQDTKKDFNGVVDRDLKNIKKALQKEKRQVENYIEVLIPNEIQKARTFLRSQIGELNRLQKNLDDTLKKAQAKAGKKRTAKKTTRKKTVRKKATRRSPSA